MIKVKYITAEGKEDDMLLNIKSVMYAKPCTDGTHVTLFNGEDIHIDLPFTEFEAIANTPITIH